MALQDKYRDLISSANQMGLSGLQVSEEGGKLKIKGTAKHLMDKDEFWTKLKQHAGYEGEVAADIRVADESIYGVYTVKSGDNLSKIAQAFLGDANAYMQIFNLNTDQLSDPDKLKVGQQLKLPKRP
jgi:nucleoid-associated protein YgaU